MHSNFIRTMQIGTFCIEMSYPETFDGNYWDFPNHISVYGMKRDSGLPLIAFFYWEDFLPNYWEEIVEKMGEIERLKYVKAEEMIVDIVTDMREYRDNVSKQYA